MADQEIQEAKDRVNALRRQIRQEQAERAVVTAETAKDMRLSALDEEEASLMRQLEEVRSIQMPTADRGGVVVPVMPDEGAVNVSGESPREGQDPLAEGGAFMETVDRHGNLVRMPVRAENTEVVLTSEGRAAGAPPADATAEVDPSTEANLNVPADAPDADPADLGTREADPAPPEVPDGANLGARRRGGPR